MNTSTTAIDSRRPASTGIDAPIVTPLAVPADDAAPAASAFQMITVTEVRVGPRHRKDLGDLTGLAHSIQAVGLLQPIVITPDRQLIAGQRRLEAVKLLGWAEVPARVVDLENIVRGEHDENVQRKPFTPSEAVAIGRALEAQERPKAARRQAAGRARRRRGQKNPVASGPGNLPEPETAPGDKGDTRDKVATAVGLSAKTYEKAKAVVAAAEADPEANGHLVEQMDRTGKVDPAFRQITPQQPAEGRPARPPKLPGWPKLKFLGRTLGKLATELNSLSRVRLADRDPAAVTRLCRLIRKRLDWFESAILAGSSPEGALGHE
jgi:ParB family chromosome partitioning protein